MKTECTGTLFDFQPLEKREVVASFDGGTLTSDAGGLLLREVEQRCGILRQFSGCFRDLRDAERIEHTVAELVAQRVYGIALGYEDLNDHEALRNDPVLAVLVGKEDPTGQSRVREGDRGRALAGKSTLNRLELTRPGEPDRYKKIEIIEEAVNAFFVEVFLQAHERAPRRMVLDLDATDDPLHGQQEGRFFHGYYREYCYLPLYIFCGEHLLCSRLRESNRDASAGSVEEVARIVERVRASWPKVEIAIRGDAGFCRESLMSWCEANGVHYVFGLAKNSRLLGKIERQMKKAMKRYARTQKAARVYGHFLYRTERSWSRKRRVVAKAEYLSKGANPRFVVTSYGPEAYDAQTLYEKEYCARGEMENRIKEQQLYLFADRTSSHEMWANQIRLWFSSVAYLLVSAFRRLGLQGTEMAKAQCQTIRLKLFKLGARIRVTVRRIVVSMASGCPDQALFAAAYANLKAIPLFSP